MLAILDLRLRINYHSVMNYKENNKRLIFYVPIGIFVLSCLLPLPIVEADHSVGYIPGDSVLIFLFKADKSDPGVAALSGRALEKLSKGRLSQQVGQNILSLVAGEVLIVGFPSNSDKKTDGLEFGIVSGYVRENFDFTLNLKGNPIRVKAKSIPNLESKVLSPLIEQALDPEGENFTRKKFKGRQIVALDKTDEAQEGITAYSFTDGQILFGSTATAIRELIRSHDKKSQDSYPFYPSFKDKDNDGMLILDNTHGQLPKFFKNNKDLIELGTLLTIVQIRKAALFFNLVDENSLTGTLDILPGKEGNLSLLEKELALLGIFLKGRLFLEGLNWSNEVQKQGTGVQMSFKIKNLKNYFE